MTHLKRHFRFEQLKRTFKALQRVRGRVKDHRGAVCLNRKRVPRMLNEGSKVTVQACPGIPGKRGGMEVGMMAVTFKRTDNRDRETLER